MTEIESCGSFRCMPTRPFKRGEKSGAELLRVLQDFQDRTHSDTEVQLLPGHNLVWAGRFLPQGLVPIIHLVQGLEGWRGIYELWLLSKEKSGNFLQALCEIQTRQIYAQRKTALLGLEAVERIKAEGVLFPQTTLNSHSTQTSCTASFGQVLIAEPGLAALVEAPMCFKTGARGQELQSVVVAAIFVENLNSNSVEVKPLSLGVRESSQQSLPG